jgi:tetratricopeptide (TPR) repeat protein
MMDTAMITDLITGKTPFSEDTLSELTERIEQEPDSQAVQILYVLNLKALNDNRFELALRKLAGRLYRQAQGETAVPEKKSPVHPAAAAVDYVAYMLKEESESADEPVKPLKHQDAIDKFLASDAQAPIKLPTETSELPAAEETSDAATEMPEFPEASEETTEETPVFSETMAKIYLKQKKYAKALEIIRQLNLIYPEKSCYFADQIRFLEKLINNTKNKE